MYFKNNNFFLLFLCFLCIFLFIFISYLDLDNLWIVEEHFWESNVPALLFDQGSNFTIAWIFFHKKNVFQAKQQPLSKVMGATWPEWGRRALLDVLPIETCSVTYQQALQSPAYSMFKCCVNTAPALPFIFVSLLPWRCQTMLGATGRGEASAGLVREHICQRLIETFGRWAPASLMKSESCGSQRLSHTGWDRLLGFSSLLYFFVRWGLMFAKGQKMRLHRSHSGGGPLRAFILKEWFCCSSKGIVSWSCFWFFSHTL